MSNSYSTRRANENLSAKDHEVLSLRRQVDGTSEELTEVGRTREVALRENRRLQDDLATMTRENQVTNLCGALVDWLIDFTLCLFIISTCFK